MTPPRLAQNFQYTDVASPKRLRQLESERVVGSVDGGEGWRNNLCGTRGPLARHSWKVSSRRGRRSCWKSCNVLQVLFPSTCCAFHYTIYRQTFFAFISNSYFSREKTVKVSLVASFASSFNYLSFGISVSIRSPSILYSSSRS